jgi:hypothetical protein
MPSVAPLVAGFRRRLANLPGPVRASGEASTGEPVLVELFVAGEWVDITSYCMVRDDSGQVRITYGIQGGEGSQTDRATASLQLRNDDGRFSPRNPSGPYFGLIGRNTPLRISVPDGNGGKSYRLWGEVAEWAPNWDRSGNDVWVDVSVVGPLQRLAQGPAPERSVIYRAITDPALTGLVAYWPCEDPEGSTSIASALTSGSAMTVTGSPQLAAFDRFGASDPLPTLTGVALTGGVARYDMTSVTQYQVRFLLAIPAAGLSDLDAICRVQVTPASIGQVEFWRIHYNDPPGGVGSYGGRGTLSVTPYDTDGSPLGYSGTPSISLDVRGRLLRVSMEASNSGANQNVTLRVLDVETGVTDSTTILTGANVSRVRSVDMAPAEITDPLDGSEGSTGTAVGHITVQTTVTPIDDLGRGVQPSGETAGRRIQRLCGEEGIPFDWVGDLDDTVPLGGQARQNPLSLMQEACLADGGLLYENRVILGLGYRTRTSLYNQDPTLVLSYTGHQLAQVPVPVEDDRTTQNRVTVTVAGVSATYEETDGALSVELPPAGVGVYGSDVTLNLADSERQTLLDQAAWRVHLGTVDEARFPQISVNLAHSSITPDMRRAILAMRLGDRIQITSPPAWLPPDTIDQLALGIEESITHFEHRLTFLCAPASPYTVGVLDSDEAVLDTDGSVLAEAVSSAATVLDVTATSGPIWVSDPSEFPFDIRVGGEVMTVSAISPHASDTFTRSSASGWGTSSSGHTWTETGGATSDRTVTGTAGVINLGATPTTIRFNTLADAVADTSVLVSISPGQVSTGNSLAPGVVMRWQDSSNFYRVRLLFRIAADGQTVGLNFTRGSTDLGTYETGVTYAANDVWWLRTKVEGHTISARAWKDGTTEPSAWQLVATVAASTISAGSVGVSASGVPGITNASPTVSYDAFAISGPQTFAVTRSVNGVTKSHAAGADVRLATPTILAL